MAPAQQAVVAGIANEDGVIEVDKPSIDTDFNIRQEDLRMFETETNRLLITTDDLSDGVFLEVIPGADGFMTEIVEEPTTDLAELTPADPAENEVDADVSTTIEVRMD